MELTKPVYDALVILGYEFDENGKLPDHVNERVLKAAYMYHNHVASRIALSGRWSMKIHLNKGGVPYTESGLMEKMLISHGVNRDAILKEERSMDTIGNAYFIKTEVLIPAECKTILVMGADYHMSRVEYIFTKVFGKDYRIDFMGTHTGLLLDEAFMEEQRIIEHAQRKFLEHMPHGDHPYLEPQLYKSPYYPVPAV